jgi:nitroreductase
MSSAAAPPEKIPNEKSPSSMELMEAIYRRRAIRRYTQEEVSSSTLHELLHAAAQAPSPLNLQPWSFAVFCGRQQLAALSVRVKDHLTVALPPLYQLHEHTAHMSDPTYNVFHGAPVLIVVCAKSVGYTPGESCAMAAQNLMLAAHALGLGSCPVGFVRTWLRLPHIKAELGISSSLDPTFPLVVGHPAETPTPRPRVEPEIAVWSNATRD